MIAFLFQFIRWLTLISQPLLITLILEHIQNPKWDDGGVLYGLGLALLYILLDIFSALLIEQFNFTQLVLGVKAKYALVWIIYDKIFTLSPATNKKFSQGEIINFINVDVEKIPSLMKLLPLVSRFPIQLVFSIVLLFLYFDVLFIGSLGVGFGLSFVGFIIAKIKAKVQIRILKEKDKRMRTTTVSSVFQWREFRDFYFEVNSIQIL